MCRALAAPLWTRRGRTGCCCLLSADSLSKPAGTRLENACAAGGPTSKLGAAWDTKEHIRALRRTSALPEAAAVKNQCLVKESGQNQNQPHKPYYAQDAAKTAVIPSTAIVGFT